MTKRIIFKNDEGRVCVIVPAPNSGLTIEQVAQKDVPTGKPYKIIDETELPADRSDRNFWTIDDALLTDGVGA